MLRHRGRPRADSFPPDDFASTLVRITNQVQTLMKLGRDAGRLNAKSLRKQAKMLEKSLALYHKGIHTRASLILCQVALEELHEARHLLMDSLKYSGFPKALRRDVDAKGSVGHQLLRKLPGWLYSLLFPTWQTDEDDEDDDGDEGEG